MTYNVSSGTLSLYTTTTSSGEAVHQLRPNAQPRSGHAMRLNSRTGIEGPPRGLCPL